MLRRTLLSFSLILLATCPVMAISNSWDVRNEKLVLAEETAVAPPGGMQLLSGYIHTPMQGIDSQVGEITKEGGLRISYEIGRVTPPGQPRMGGSFLDRPKLAPRESVQWYREQTINGQSVHLAMTNDNVLLVSFPGKGINFRSAIGSTEQLVDAMLMILTYPQPPVEETSQPSSDTETLIESPTTITIDGKALVLHVEGINNLMPMIGPGPGVAGGRSSRIYFIVRLATTDRSSLPEGVTFDTVYGVQGEKKWEMQSFDTPRSSAPSMLEIVARNAPVWTASDVDIIVKLRDSANKEYLIRATDVETMDVH
jgi:hypothetical protein